MTILEQEGFQTFRYYICLKSGALLSEVQKILYTFYINITQDASDFYWLWEYERNVGMLETSTIWQNDSEQVLLNNLKKWLCTPLYFCTVYNIYPLLFSYVKYTDSILGLFILLFILHLLNKKKENNNNIPV